MKKGFAVFAALLLAAFIGAPTLAEETFFEEAFDGGSGVCEDDFSFEEAFDDSFAEESFLSPEDGEDAAGPDEPEEAADGTEGRSIVTLGFDDCETPTETEWWWSEPILAAIPQKAAGTVKLIWAQNVGAAKKLPKGVKYFVYAENPETGLARQVKAVGSKKTTLPAAYTGGLGKVVGPGGSVTLKKQKTGTKYFVRAERQVKKKGAAPVETYGWHSDKVEYEGDDGLWKKIWGVTVERNEMSYEASFVKLTWIANEEYDDWIFQNYRVFCESWNAKGKKSTREIDLPSLYKGYDSDKETIDSEKNDDGTYTHYMNVRIPDGAAKLRFVIRVYKEEGGPFGVKTSPTLALASAAWKKVYGVSARASITEGLDVVYLDWDAFNGLAKRYALGGFFDSRTEVVWDNAANCYDLSGAPDSALWYDISWYRDGKHYNLTTGSYGGDPYLDVTGQERIYSGFPDFSEIGEDVVARFAVVSLVKAPKNLKVTVSVTPYSGKKAGQKAKAKVTLVENKRAAPTITWKDLGEYGMDPTMREIEFSFSSPVYAEKMQYVITGLGKPITVTVHTKAAWWDENEQLPDSVEVSDPDGITTRWPLVDSRGIVLYVSLKPGKKTVASIKARIPTPDAGTITTLTRKLTFTVPKKTATGGARIDAEETKYYTDGSQKWLKVVFYDMNSKSDHFHVTICGQPGQNPTEGYIHKNEVTFAKGDVYPPGATFTLKPSPYEVTGEWDVGKYELNFRLPDSDKFKPWYSIMVETYQENGGRAVNKNTSVYEYRYDTGGGM